MKACGNLTPGLHLGYQVCTAHMSFCVLRILWRVFDLSGVGLLFANICLLSAICGIAAADISGCAGWMLLKFEVCSFDGRWCQVWSVRSLLISALHLVNLLFCRGYRIDCESALHGCDLHLHEHLPFEVTQSVCLSTRFYSLVTQSSVAQQSQTCKLHLRALPVLFHQRRHWYWIQLTASSLSLQWSYPLSPRQHRFHPSHQSKTYYSSSAQAHLLTS